MLQKDLLTIKDADLQATSFGKSRGDEPKQQALLDERLDGSMLPCYKTGFNDLWIQWTYTIDLDREIFSVDNGGHFKLNRIPRDVWIEALAIDSDNKSLILASPCAIRFTRQLDPPVRRARSQRKEPLCSI